jgi:carboxylesterase
MLSRLRNFPSLAALFAAFVATGRALPAQQTDTAYSRSVAAIARRQGVDDSVGAPGARSILLTDGAPAPRVIVLLHGLTDSPRQFEALAYLLHADGNAVYVPRLPQHGLRDGSVGALSRLTAGQLRGVADSVVDEARGLGDSVVVVGLSMGATMGAWIAEELVVTRAVLIAPAIEPGLIPSMLDRPLMGLANRLPSMTRESPQVPGRPDREAGFNSRAVAQIFDLGRSVLRDAAREAPRTHDIAVLVNAGDRTVKTSATDALSRNWSTHGASVSVFELPDSLRLPHNIIDPLRGRAGGESVLAMIRDLAYGQSQTALAPRISPHDE